jgi:hypothetical protein
VDCLAGQGPVLKSATILSSGAASSKIGGGANIHIFVFCIINFF